MVKNEEKEVSTLAERALFHQIIFILLTIFPFIEQKPKISGLATVPLHVFLDTNFG